jgi:hypothetical protein
LLEQLSKRPKTATPVDLEEVMKIAVVVLLLAASAFAQESAAAVTSACGQNDGTFNVKLDESRHPLAQPEPGKARVYFIQEKAFDTFAVTAEIGLDGAWVGANKNNSYFAVSVVPGEHHVCVSVQSFRGHPRGFVHFTAEAGRVYYFSGRVIYGEQSEANLFLEEIDSDQGKYLIASYPLSVATPKK